MEIVVSGHNEDFLIHSSALLTFSSLWWYSLEFSCTIFPVEAVLLPSLILLDVAFSQKSWYYAKTLFKSSSGVGVGLYVLSLNNLSVDVISTLWRGVWPRLKSNALLLNWLCEARRSSLDLKISIHSSMQQLWLVTDKNMTVDNIHMTGALTNPKKLTLKKTWIAWLIVWTLKSFFSNWRLKLKIKNWKLKIEIKN